MRTVFNTENGEFEYACNEKEFGQFSLVIGGIGIALGGYLGFCAGVGAMNKKWCKAIPEIINEAGFKGCEATLDAIENMGPEARKFIRRHGTEIAGIAGNKFYRDKDIRGALKACKKHR